MQKCGDGAVGIILHGLVSKPEHNGKPARVLGWDAGRQRFEVRLSDGKMLLVKPDNVRSDNAELAVNSGREHSEQLLEMAGGQADAEASSRVEAPGEHVTQEMAIGHEDEGDALAVATAAQPCAAQ